MSAKHKCKIVKGNPRSGWICAYYDCGDKAWRLATQKVHRYMADAAAEARQWGSPKNVRITFVGTNLWIRPERVAVKEEK